MRTVLVLTLALLLSACAAGQPAAPTEIPSVEIPTQAPQQAPTETPFSPTEAPHQNLVPVPTQDPSLIAVVTPLPDGGILTYTSPDGRWTAESFFTFTPAGTLSKLTLRAADGSAEWVYENQQGQGLGFTVPQPIRWEADTIYFSEAAQPDGCAPGFNNGGNLLSMDLATGEVATLVEGEGWWISPSPDLSQVALIPYGAEPLLIVRGVQTREQIEIALPAEAADLDRGAIIWSPDGTKLALTLATNPCFASETAAHHVVMVDLATGSSSIIYTDEAATLVTESWPVPGYLVLRGESGGGRWLDALTGELVPLP